MIRALAAITVAATLLAGTPAAAVSTVDTAGDIVEVTGFGSDPGNLRMLRYTPPDLPAGRPVVLALHGCTQNGASYGTDSGWVQLAQRWKFSVVLPEQRATNNANRCFTWYDRADTSRGRGEVESIAQMVRRALADAGTTAKRSYVTGLSAGGAMTAAMLATYPELFAAGGIVAGVAYRCASSLVEAFSCMSPGRDLTPAALGDAVRAASSHSGPWPEVTLWQGTADRTVAPSNARELVEQWTNVHGVSSTPTRTDTVAGHPHAVYADAMETFTILGMGHGQPVAPAQGCGRSAPYFLDAGICAAARLAASWALS
ncbi:PHB depolymerase family esterase [Allokutzneria sp. A3M-2-11 16]|uniref:extracellular catalytic domain type 1 short-chain-length polyhydroxyalkanoate depolymerase n=1 Tax=Allokutzneria sp. A3M-2-11 16 TaxID=2962043 RepID=UPI0020B8AA54|nr:PHB depolymerase family esterase [Allokutzneria sp. A3M-2-11 16]MCP3804051.1 PHB depolymerase family esterase [Allokutzneria sp. A3M-2-11 16]